MRPLGIGEIMDRAVTVFVRNAWTFFAVAAVLYVPLAFAQLSMGDFWKWYLAALTGGPGASSVPPAQMMSGLAGAETIQLAVLVILMPLAYAGGLYAAKRFLDGERAGVKEILAFALRRWGRVLLYLLLWIVVFAALSLGFLLLGVVVGASFALHSVVVSVLAGVLLFAVVIVAVLALSVSAGVGLVSTVAEDAGVLDALRNGIGRTLNREYFWRSVLLGLIIAAISFGFALVLSIAGFTLLQMLHTPLPLIAINAVAGVVEFGFFATLLVTYYNDLRVRREGVDLSELAATLGQPAGSP